MPRRIVLEKAFVITSQGRLLDAGVVERRRQWTYLYRLHPDVLRRTGRLESPEQIALLFAAYHLKGGESQCGEPFFIYPDTLGPQGRNEEDFPGLALYMKRHFTEKRAKHIENPPDWVFGSLAFGWLFRVSYEVLDGKRHYGIVATGLLPPEDFLLLEARDSRVSTIYDALRTGDFQSVGAFRVRDGADVEALIENLHIAVASTSNFRGGSEIEPSSANSLAVETGTISKTATPRSIRERLDKVLGQAFTIDGLLVPDNWGKRIAQWQSSILLKLYRKLPGFMALSARRVSLGWLIIEGLKTLTKQEPEAELILALFHGHCGDYAMAVAYAASYCEKHPQDGLAWVFLGYFQRCLKRHKEAKEAFKQAIRFGERAAGRIGIGITCVRERAPEEGLRHIEAVLAEDPGNISAQAAQAMWLAYFGDATKAITRMNAVISRTPPWLDIRDSTVSCFYAAGHYREAIDVARAILSETERPHDWVCYTLVASLYCLGEYEAAKKEAEQALLVVTDRTARGYLHIVLRKLAAQAKSPREAVRHSVAACRLVPERSTTSLWLAADLEWAGHPGLAKWFWGREIDPSQMEKGEELDAAILYSIFGKYKLAAKCLMAPEEIGDLSAVAAQIPEDHLAQLCNILHGVFLFRLEGVAPGEWRRPFEVNRRLAVALPESTVVRLFHFADVAALAGWAKDEESLAVWDAEFGRLDYASAPSLIRFAFCEMAGRYWRSGKRNVALASRLAVLSVAAIREYLAEASPCCDTVAIAGRLLEALLEVGSSEETAVLVEEFADWASSAEPESIPLFCDRALPGLMYQAGRQMDVRVASTLTHLGLALLRRTSTSDRAKSLAYAVSLGCSIVCTSVGGADTGGSLIRDLEECIARHADNGIPEDVFVDARANIGMARFHVMCEIDRRPDGDLLAYLRQELDYLLGAKAETPWWNSYAVCVLLGGAAASATNAFRDGVAAEALTLLEERYGHSDHHARLVSWAKRNVRAIRVRRPVAVSVFLRPEEELENRVQAGLDRLADVASIWEHMPEEGKKGFSESMRHLFEQRAGD